ncbi:MAG: hypothetical protein JGK17_20065 [Microcoleus sp. PH2017_10_PVI_O_A]|nr:MULTISPECIES: hypothetical protein [unclassified Microcoleus]MCC3407843.1 hypothetical protein [Microcoleus sp. PH2017_10_PVI_O_A]MCC3461994.1 hypothetical protein [Microcoleus sp. PH2017_11_PCY_U_A]MCC3480462.1 hypothetical protein [Microcoleus sp. PH2017_12_PCY_D_A]MCC3530249.1 hypothetical protein [Microcoleus sp. PH2017_21_RUC_O_A]MCC3542550.1 hypothetical protein [Microcoleus sp. PH2017_22_RUC_O_B]
MGNWELGKQVIGQTGNWELGIGQTGNWELAKQVIGNWELVINLPSSS